MCNAPRPTTDDRLISELERLPADYWDFKTEDTRAYTHGIHSYPAMMVSPISRNILRIMRAIRPVRALLDPFAGSGTVLVEGLLAGVETVHGNDINPLASFLCRVKTTPLSMDVLDTTVETLRERLLNAARRHRKALQYADVYILEDLGLDITDKGTWSTDAPRLMNAYAKERRMGLRIPDFKNMGYWFRPRVVLELACIKKAVQTVEDDSIREFILAAFSETIRLVSNRRNGEFKMFRMKPEKILRFQPNVFEQFLTLLDRNVEKMRDFVTACGAFCRRHPAVIHSDNACTLESLEDGLFDLIVTSPPYGDSRTTVAYGEFSRLSLQWLDMFELSEREIMGLDRSLMGGGRRDGFDNRLPSDALRQSLERIRDNDPVRAGEVYSFYADLDASVAAIASKTARDGYQFWVVGNRTVKGEKLLTDRILAELAAAHGLTHVCTINRAISNKTMPCVNCPTNIAGETASTMTNEHIVVLRK